MNADRILLPISGHLREDRALGGCGGSFQRPWLLELPERYNIVMDSKNRLTRRQAIAALGAIGVGGAGESKALALDGAPALGQAPKENPTDSVVARAVERNDSAVRQ